MQESAGGAIKRNARQKRKPWSGSLRGWFGGVETSGVNLASTRDSRCLNLIFLVLGSSSFLLMYGFTGRPMVSLNRTIWDPP